MANDLPKWTHFRERRGDGEYRLSLDALEIIVHRYIHDPGKWFASCHGIGIERRPLQSAASGDACEEAHRLCIARVQAFVTALLGRDPKALADEVRAASVSKVEG